jgi:two-component system, LuxR family, sensor kinase FixL
MTPLELTRQLSARKGFAPAGLAVAVCLGYYVGALVGLELRVPATTPSVVWPPNATLTAALLLTRRDRWWIVLAAALPAHLAVQLRTEWPGMFVAAVFLTNCLEALIAAIGFRLLSDGAPRLDSFARLRAFFVAAGLAAPLLSSFADAGLVHGLFGEPYWQVWRFRLFSNVLAELTVAPAILGAVSGASQWLRRKSPWPVIEASTIALGLLGACLLDFTGNLPATPALRAMLTETPGVVQLPFVLWAAVRFGPGGTAVTLLLVTVVNSWQVVHPTRLLVSPLAPVTSVTAMTLALSIAAVTLLSLSTLIEERRHSQAMLAARLRFEELLSAWSREFVQLPSNRMDEALSSWLGRIGSFLEVRCLGVLVAATGTWDPTATAGGTGRGLRPRMHPAFSSCPGPFASCRRARPPW